jgi:energy-coupling factor transporter ATP-binding protein EcfA2
MASKTPAAAVSAFHEILSWSADRPDWQRDALRRIVVNGTVDGADLKELERICRAKHNVDTSTAPPIQADPLAPSHLPPGPGFETSVTLVSIGNLRHVNRIPSDQTLTFGQAPGLTVVYGDNGSGKSGYARVIKKACRSRGAPPTIRPNAFAPSSAGPATAEIVCGLAGTNHPISWQDGVPSDVRLANVFVFDAVTAEHYLEEDGPTAFTPRGLDILPKLSKCCDTISGSLQQEIDRIKADIDSSARNWKYNLATVVGKLVSSLSAKTKPADVDRFSQLTESEAQRLRELTEALQADSKRKVMETRASATRLRAFASKAAAAAKTLADDEASTLQILMAKAKASADAAVLVATGRFDASFLPGTGGNLWRELWEAARAYSTTAAYDGREFPVTTDGAKCVLCQQDLDEDAVNRLAAFDSFCKDRSQQLAEQAAERLEEAVERINTIQALSPEFTRIDADLAAVAVGQRAKLDEFVKAADERLARIKDNFAKGLWTDLGILPMSPDAVITQLAASLEERAKMEESADDPATREKLTSERDDLAAREWLAGVKADVVEQIGRYTRIAAIELCKKDTDTRKITDKNTDLGMLLVTKAYQTRFEAEVNKLGLCSIAVKMEDAEGKKGERRFGLRLEKAQNHKVKDIASEGEQRCLALAAFLAELSLASHQSALVFDDPVSSLDHWFRKKLARRLAEECQLRQVIVLTHDVVFLNDLRTQAEDLKVAPEFRHLEWNGEIPGQCQDGLPWDYKSPEDRLDKLEKQQCVLAKKWGPQPNEEDVREMREAYSWLRATLERIVERVVFADVVFRFRSYIDMKKLKEVVGFPDSECREILRLDKRCCDVTEAHDPASGRQSPVPSPAELKQDIADTSAVLAAIRLRRKSMP